MRKWLALGMLAAVGCSSTTFITNNVIATDGGDAAPVVVDAGSEAALDAGADSGADTADAKVCPAASPAGFGSSTTCEPIGTGQPTFCDPACGHPAYGYVTQSGTPALPGCVRIGASQNFCCPGIACTRNAAKDGYCVVAGKPNSWSCAAKSGDAGDVVLDGQGIATPPGNCQGSAAPYVGLGVASFCCDTP